MPSQFTSRLQLGRIQRAFRHRVLPRVREQSGPLFHLLSRAWLGFGDQQRQSHRLQVARYGGLGDVLMCTPALRALKRSNPDCHITFFSAFGELLVGLPFVDEVRKLEERSDDAIVLTYEELIPPRRHIASLFGDLIGVNVRNVRPACAVDAELLAKWSQFTQQLRPPVMIVYRHASSWTPNKEWPAEYWNAALPELCRFGSVVEVGSAKELDRVPDELNYVDLREKTSLRELVAIVASGDLTVGPISGPTHIAAAFGVPSVVLYGGYENPICSRYLGNLNLAENPSCSPCWLREPCPYDRMCLRRIPASRLVRAVKQLWTSSKSTSKRRNAPTVRITKATVGDC